MNIDDCEDLKIQSYDSNSREYACLEYVIYEHFWLINIRWEVMPTGSQ